jgi:ubiquinone/menaquinone biosynthesis C-methylase UbiE
MNDEELHAYYEKLSVLSPQTTEQSDVGTDCMRYIVDYAKEHPEMTTYFDCACGGGGVTKNLAALGRQVTGMDFVISETLKDSSNVTFVKGDIRHIPYEDKSFDVVVSAHTLEHIIRIQDAIAELRRVTKHKLIIIVPCQREYKYTFDTHIHFFPYKESFHRIMENPDADCFYLDHDIVYVEDRN